MSQSTRVSFEIETQHTFPHNGKDLVEWWLHRTCESKELADIVVESVKSQFEAVRIIRVVKTETREEL